MVANPLDVAFDRCDSYGYGCVSLVHLRKALSQYTRLEQDTLITAGRIAGKYSLSSAERQVSDEERAALIEEHGERLLYISRRS